MKYIVFWIVLLTSPAPCHSVQIDQVTGLPSVIGFNCLVYHTKTDTIYRTEVFTDSTKMQRFVELLNQDSRVDSFSVTEIKETVIHEYKQDYDDTWIDTGRFRTDSTTFNYKQDSITVYQNIDWIIKNKKP